MMAARFDENGRMEGGEGKEKGVKTFKVRDGFVSCLLLGKVAGSKPGAQVSNGKIFLIEFPLSHHFAWLPSKGGKSRLWTSTGTET